MLFLPMKKQWYEIPVTILEKEDAEINKIPFLLLKKNCWLIDTISQITEYKK